jgi:hypothetical protein
MGIWNVLPLEQHLLRRMEVNMHYIYVGPEPGIRNIMPDFLLSYSSQKCSWKNP